MIFLFMLFSLISSGKINAQYCLDFKYDKSGNRTEMYAHDCGFEYKEHTREIVDEEMSEKTSSEDLFVYPNPNNGVFVVNVRDREAETVSYQIYNTTGILVQNGECSVNQNIDMANNPAGVYLLRIIIEKYACSCIVVKL